MTKDPQLASLVQLHSKLQDVEKLRKDNREAMEDTNQNYQVLKKNIKDFIRVQNVDKKKR